MYTHTVRREVDGKMVETRTNVTRQIYDQLLSQVRTGNLHPSLDHGPRIKTLDLESRLFTSVNIEQCSLWT